MRRKESQEMKNKMKEKIENKCSKFDFINLNNIQFILVSLVSLLKTFLHLKYIGW